MVSQAKINICAAKIKALANSFSFVRFLINQFSENILSRLSFLLIYFHCCFVTQVGLDIRTRRQRNQYYYKKSPC